MDRTADKETSSTLAVNRDPPNPNVHLKTNQASDDVKSLDDAPKVTFVDMMSNAPDTVIPSFDGQKPVVPYDTHDM